MKDLMEKWNKFVDEARAPKDPTYRLYLYEFTADCVISRSKGGDKEETFSEFRAIPEVTIVRQVPGSADEDTDMYYSTVSIRFKSDMNEPQPEMRGIIQKLRRIKGVQIVNYNGDLKKKEHRGS
tara:strand:- start:109 stop:480 length:372 start_codon:yes stop_codon:yes gene_type:complete